MNAAQRLIPPLTLAGLGNLELLARTVVEGSLTGVHRSGRFGFSQEFAEYRSYAAGDDPRFIDWNVYSRTDRMVLKQFYGDTNTRLLIALDVSASMGVAPSAGAVGKLDYARFVAAALIYLAARQHDTVGLAAFAGQLRELWMPRTRRGAAALYHRLDALSAAGTTGWQTVFAALGQRLRRRSLVVLLSDFYADPAELGASLRGLAAAGHDLLLVHVLDPAERHPKIVAGSTVEDVESGALLDADSDDLRRHYPARFARHAAALRDVTAGARGHYLPMDTDQPLDRLLARYLRFRARHP